MRVFPKIGVPQNGWFIMETFSKMDDLGVPLFSETPICLSKLFGQNSEFSKPPSDRISWHKSQKIWGFRNNKFTPSSWPTCLKSSWYSTRWNNPNKNNRIQQNSRGVYVTMTVKSLMVFLFSEANLLYFAGHLPGPSTIRGGCCQSGTFDAQCVVVDCDTHFVL